MNTILSMKLTNRKVGTQPAGKPLHAHNIVRRDFRHLLALEGYTLKCRSRTC